MQGQKSLEIGDERGNDYAYHFEIATTKLITVTQAQGVFLKYSAR